MTYLKELRRNDLWEIWKKYARPEIFHERGQYYSSENYEKQKEEEYARRFESGRELYDLLRDERCDDDSLVIDVGSNEGDEVSDLPFRMVCIEPSALTCKRGKEKYPHIKFVVGTADELPFERGIFDAYISLRTWCIAGVIPYEAFDATRSVLVPEGLVVVSFPLRFERIKERTLDHAIDDSVKPVAEMTFEIFRNSIAYVKTLSTPEDFFIYGRLKKLTSVMV